MYRCLVVIFLFVSVLNSYSQKNFRGSEYFTEAENYLLSEEYIEALSIYKILEEHDSSNANFKYKIGLCYLNIPDQEHRATPYLEYAVDYMAKDYIENSYEESRTPLNTLLYLGNSYRLNNELDRAVNSYSVLLDSLSPNDLDGIRYLKKQISTCNNARDLQSSPISYTSTNLGDIINNVYANFNPVISGDESTIVYMTALKFYDAVYFSKKVNGQWSKPKNITSKVGSDGECYCLSLSNDGTKLLLLRYDEYNNRDIYLSRYIDDEWQKIEKLNQNINTLFWETHACFSPDEKTIYFTSNRIGGIGGMDIYKSEIDNSGNWGEAINLGIPVNTPFNEETPFITNNGKTLYFSSQGHYNMGGYDIFLSNLTKDNKWTTPLNIGYPLNTTNENLFFTPAQNGKAGYLSLFELQNFGSQDLYRVEVLSSAKPKKFEIKGIMSLQNNDPFTNGKISFLDNTSGDIIETVQPEPETGKFSFITSFGTFDLVFTEDGYQDQAEKVEIPRDFSERKITVNAQLIPIPVVVKHKNIYLRNIYFEFDKYSLTAEAVAKLDSLVIILDKYPLFTLEIIGNTDSKGADDYNQVLSEKRVGAVKEYILNKGIAEERLIFGAVGENNPIAVNTNSDGSDNPDGRKYNRRVDINIYKSDYEFLLKEILEIPPQLKFIKK